MNKKKAWTLKKETYEHASNKKQVREFMFSLFAKQYFRKIVGLPGPDINNSISFYKSKGYDLYEFFEMDMDTVMKQLTEIKTSNTTLTYGNIIDADASKEDVVYDLDYCVTVRNMSDHIEKFKNNYIMTFSRRIGNEETINEFFQATKEDVVSKTTLFSPIEHEIYLTNKGNKYYYAKYRDTSPMCCIAKINHHLN